jgi:hypothetical protein
MAERLPALCVGLTVLYSLLKGVSYRDTEQLEDADQLKNPVISSGIEPAMFCFVP